MIFSPHFSQTIEAICKKYGLVFAHSKTIITIWPHLKAAGRYDKDSPDEVCDDVEKRLQNLVYKKGALNRHHYTAAQQEAIRHHSPSPKKSQK